MKKTQYTLNLLLIGVVSVAVLAALLTKTWMPRAIIPQLDAPNAVLLILIALVLDHYIAPGAKRNPWGILLAGLTFGLLPYAGGFATWLEAGWTALLGSAAFWLTTWLFDTMTDRLSTGPASKAAPVISAFGLYLAAQISMGIF